jgi:SLT domain-containing protein
MADIFVGSVSVGVTPDARGIDDELRRQLIPPANRVGAEMGKEMTKAIISNLDIGSAFTDSVRANLAQIAHAGDDAGKRFADASKARIKEEFKGLDVHANLKLDTAGAKAEWDKFKAETENGKGIVAKIALDTTKLSRDIAGSVTSGVTASRGIFSRLFGGSGGGGGGIAGDITSGAGSGGIGGAAGGAAGAAGGAGGGLGGGILNALYGGPQALVTVPATAGLIAVLAQAVAGAVVSGFGAGIAYIATKGAAKDPGIQKEFGSIGKQFSQAITNIGTTFVPVLQSIAKTLSPVIETMRGTLGGAAVIISPSVQKFVDTLIAAFGTPAVQNSIDAVAKSFAAILTAVTPDVTGGVESIADSITRIADSITKNPKAFADFINFLFEIGILGINAFAVLSNIANVIETVVGKFSEFFGPGKNNIGNLIVQSFIPNSDLNKSFDKNIAKPIRTWWDKTFTVKNFEKYGTDIINGLLTGAKDAISGISTWVTKNVVDPFIHAITMGFGIGSPAKTMIPIGADIISGFLNGILNAMAGIGNWLMKNVYQPFVGWFSGASNSAFKTINWLWNEGYDVLSGFLQGILDAMSDISSWIDKNVYQPIKQAIIDNFKITSPAKTMIPLGKQVIQGIIHGMISEGKHFDTFVADIFGSWPKAIMAVLAKSTGIDISKLPQNVKNFLSGTFGSLGAGVGKVGHFFAQMFSSGGAGVTRWMGTVQKALAMLGLPQSLAPKVLYQIQTESGGNPNAINLTDINARRGDPSRGLLQTIGATFSQYHVPGTSWNIYDPLANIAAAVNYAEHRYGRTLQNSRGQGIGSGVGYDLGGWLPPGVTMAVNNTGRNELVLSPAQQAELLGSGRIDNAVADGPTYNAHFDSLTGQAIESHVRTAFAMMSLTQGHLARPGRRT